MSTHAIIIIKNENDEYLQCYDERWNSYLFLNCKLYDGFTKTNIIEHVVNKLKLSNDNLECEYLGDKVHKKYSESAKIEKEYHHYFYRISIKNMPDDLKSKTFIIDNITYSWYSLEKLENDDRIMQVNSDIVHFVKTFDKRD